MTLPVLHQFQFSHYNEKARWALDFKGVAHRRRSLLPGPHMVPMMRLSGQKSVPVLCLGGEVVAGSDKIIDAVERSFPQPSLFPADEAQRRAALETAKWFDDDIGPQIRRAYFFDVLPGSAYAAEGFIIGRGALTKALYRAVFPAIRAVMMKDMKIDAAGAALGVERTREGLDRVAQLSAATGYLVGDCFSVADLTAAALLSPAVMPSQFPYALPEPRSAGLERWLARWADHPGGKWVLAMYEKHRGKSAAVAE